MPFQLSPGVNVTEIDLTTIVPAVSTTDTAFVGFFEWGPVNEVTLIDRQEYLINRFGKPNTNVAESWFTASNFLDYGNKLHLVRVVGSEARNATEAGTYAGIIENRDDFDEKFDNNTFAGEGKWAARFPGGLGNHLRVSTCDSISGQFANTGHANLAARDTTASGGTVVAGSTQISVHPTGQAVKNFQPGDMITFDAKLWQTAGGEAGAVTATIPGEYIITGITDDVLTLNKGLEATLTDYQRIGTRKWQFADSFDAAPSTSVYAETRDAGNDEIHVVVADRTGEITGVKGTIIEKYANLSKASDAKSEDGTSNYYFDVINDKSKWIWAIDDSPTTTETVGVEGTDVLSWGDATTPGSSNTYAQHMGTGGDDSIEDVPWLPSTNDLLGGNTDVSTGTTSKLVLGYDLFSDAEELDISLILGGPHNGTVARYIIDNVAEKRKDCVAFISPTKDTQIAAGGVLTDHSDITTNVTNFRLTTGDTAGGGINSKSSSYAVMDSGWKYQYDKFNDMFRWTPLNADIAGLCVRTDESRDPWWSPAGLNRGQIKNVSQLAWNPQKAYRDMLYVNGINPVVTLKGQGTVLFGDKTLQGKPSAFDRINVRRLFIVLEKAIATAAKFTLFEFNDQFTRSQFVNMVEPFLRDVQGRRGIYDFKVVCDESNNTGEVIDRNEFIGDIYIKPARSINFIQLNFIAVRTGVDFEEVVGKF